MTNSIKPLSALQYRLVAGPVSLIPLRVLDTRRFSHSSWSVTCHILAASHAVILDRNGVTVTELLTCGDAGGEVRILTQARGDRGSFLCAESAGLRFRVRIS